MKLLYRIILFLSGAVLSCKRLYQPPATTASHHFLVINGSLVSSADSPTVITLSRSQFINQGTEAPPAEKNAFVFIESSTGETYSATETGAGTYTLAPMILSTQLQYRLHVNTADGGKFISDFVDVKQTPPIDSLTWHQQNDVFIYLDTHDPLNGTRYYRWDYTETWQYHTNLDASVSDSNGILFYVDSTNQTHTCWISDASSQILIGSSVTLTKDVINSAPIAEVAQNSQKILSRYSILVKQYALSADAYRYFSLVKKNTENLGSLFDAQPSQLSSNIHSLTNPADTVIGYFTASSVSQKRIFIDKHEVTGWYYNYFPGFCDHLGEINTDPANVFAYNNPDSTYAPYYFYSSNQLITAPKPCVDCRVQGGANHKPPFW